MYTAPCLSSSLSLSLTLVSSCHKVVLSLCAIHMLYACSIRAIVSEVPLTYSIGFLLQIFVPDCSQEWGNKECSQYFLSSLECYIDCHVATLMDWQQPTKLINYLVKKQRNAFSRVLHFTAAGHLLTHHVCLNDQGLSFTHLRLYHWKIWLSKHNPEQRNRDNDGQGSLFLLFQGEM